MTRPVGQITDLIRRLERWRAARARIAQSPERRAGSKPRPNTELDDAITYLTEYAEDCVRTAREMCNG